MSEVLSIGGTTPPFPKVGLPSGHPPPRYVPDPDAQGGVAVWRFSDALRRLVEPSTMRQARVRAVQAEIETGAYETPERISGTVDRLLDVIA